MKSAPLIFSFILASIAIKAQNGIMYYEGELLKRFAEKNDSIGLPEEGDDRVVFMGNSITEAWSTNSTFLEDNGYVNRGWSGQTTPQMLMRFRSDVIDLEPSVVVILAGINDIAGNTGKTPIPVIAGNIQSMAELALASNIIPIICAVLPAIDFPWSRGLEPAPKVIELNELLKNYAEKSNITYVDYYTAMVDEVGGLRVPEYTSEDDLVHPNEAGYTVMEGLVSKAISSVLK